MSAAPQVRAFPFVDGQPAKVTVERVNRLVERLTSAGYGAAHFANQFEPGKFTITIAADHGYTVSCLKLGSLREVAA